MLEAFSVSPMRKLSDVTLDQNPLVLPSSTTVVEACRQMSDRRAGSVAVVDERGRLVGIFTGRDAVCRVLACGRQGQGVHCRARPRDDRD